RASSSSRRSTGVTLPDPSASAPPSAASGANGSTPPETSPDQPIRLNGWHCCNLNLVALQVRRRTVAQFGSALHWGCRGRRFKSCQSDKKQVSVSEESLALFLFRPQKGGGSGSDPDPFS